MRFTAIASALILLSVRALANPLPALDPRIVATAVVPTAGPVPTPDPDPVTDDTSPDFVKTPCQKQCAQYYRNNCRISRCCRRVADV